MEVSRKNLLAVFISFLVIISFGVGDAGIEHGGSFETKFMK